MKCLDAVVCDLWRNRIMRTDGSSEKESANGSAGPLHLVLHNQITEEKERE
jgi:hypothetical protein